MAKLEEHLARCGSESLIALLGEATMTLLRRVNSSALQPKGLSYLIVRTFGEEGALRNRDIRKLLFSKLTEDEGTALCELLDLPAFASFTILNDADFDNNLSNVEILSRWYDVSYEAPDLVSRENEGSRKVTAGQKLRSHQIKAYQKLRRAIADPNASALVHMPFGAGKLRLVATAVLDLYRSEPDGPVVVWLAPGEALCDETFIELKQVWGQLGLRDVTIFRLYGNRPMQDLGSLENCIVIADITKLGRNDAGLAQLGQRTRVVVLSDAEHIGHPVGADLIEKMAENGNFSVVGISALPGSAISAGQSKNAVETVFAGSCISIEDNDPVSLLRAAGDVDTIDVGTKEVPYGVAQIDENWFDLSSESAVELSKNVDRNEAILELLLNEAKISGRVVFFATTAEHARLFAGLLELRAVRAMAVTSEKSPEQRALEIQKFNARDIKILCVHGFFLSGESVPEVSVGVIAAPTLSEAVFHEMVGRLASDRRGHKGSPLRLVLVADSVPAYRRLINSLGSWDELKI